MSTGCEKQKVPHNDANQQLAYDVHYVRTSARRYLRWQEPSGTSVTLVNLVTLFFFDFADALSIERHTEDLSSGSRVSFTRGQRLSSAENRPHVSCAARCVGRMLKRRKRAAHLLGSSYYTPISPPVSRNPCLLLPDKHRRGLPNDPGLGLRAMSMMYGCSELPLPSACSGSWLRQC